MEEEKIGNLSEKKYIILAAALLALLGGFIALAVILGGGKKNPEAKHKDIYAPYPDGYFNAGPVRISDYSGSSDKDFERAAVLADNTFNKFHRLFDIYNLYEGINNIKTINDNAGKNPVEIDPELFEFLKFSKEMYYLTDGEVNIAMGAVLSIWHDYRAEGFGSVLPDMAALEAAAEHTDIEKLILDEENLTAYLSDGEMSLDVGAVAKGYAVEKTGELLSAEGYDSFLINAGGNIKILGEKPDGSSWKTGIKSPFEPDEVIFEFYLSSSSVATSGGYERFYTVDGKRYHHIIDKETLMPAENFASVSVITKNAALADTLSTALFNMTLEQGKSLVSSLENVRAVWVTHDGKIIEN
jgi:thiamine biosynthesis lipoprotein